MSEDTEILKEILKYIKVSSIKEVKQVLSNSLTDDPKKLVYHLSDGQRNVRENCELTEIKSTGTVSSYWNQWKRLGIVEIVPVKGGERVKKVFDLEDFGIEIPKIKNIKKSSEEKSPPGLENGFIKEGA
jgi:hypothetical protein